MNQQPQERSIPTVARISSLALGDFRGFIRSEPESEHRFNTDADIVLVAGPNGYGKSSLFEAIALLLTDFSRQCTGTVRQCDDKLFSCVGKRRKDSFIIKADLLADKQGIECRLEGNRNTGTIQRTMHWKSSHIQEPIIEWPPRDSPIKEPELSARLCYFSQEHFERAFDQMSTGATVRDILEPVPKELTELTKQLVAVRKELAEEFRKRERTLSKELFDETRIELRFADGVGALRNIFKGLCQHSSDLPKFPGSAGESDLTAFAVELLNLSDATDARQDRNLPRKLMDQLAETVRRLLEQAKREGSGSPHEREPRDLLINRIQEIRSEIEAIGSKHPNLKEEVSLFSSESADDADLLGVFRSLQKNIGRWVAAKDLNSGMPHRVMVELEAVVADAAGECVQELASWLQPRQEAHTRILALKEQERSLLSQLGRPMHLEPTPQKEDPVRTQERIDDLNAVLQELKANRADIIYSWEQERYRLELKEKRAKHQEELERLKSRLDAVDEALNWLQRTIESVTWLSSGLLRKLRDVMNAVLDRFSLAEGVYPLLLLPEEKKAANEVHLRRVCQPRTKDGRMYEELSTGQKSQTAVSIMVSQNMALAHSYYHRVLILDDVSTAYDLSNLTREAILWRQLAYAGLPGGTERYQVFLSSHHEDMTRHFLDLLVPPNGREMRVIRLKEWSPHGGPIYDQFRVTPMGKEVEQVDPQDLMAWARKRLETALRRSYDDRTNH